MSCLSSVAHLLFLLSFLVFFFFNYFYFLFFINGVDDSAQAQVAQRDCGILFLFILDVVEIRVIGLLLMIFYKADYLSFL